MDYFTNDVSIVIQIRWKIAINATPPYGIISLHNIAHGTTAQLSCHVQNFVEITSLHIGW